MISALKRNENMAMREVQGGCHCGKVRFRAEINQPAQVHRCNCSICAACGYLHLIVPQARFELLTPPEALSEYRFNTGIARHLFCAHCGIKSFYVPRSNPQGYSLNVNCIDERAELALEITDFDGQNWEAHAASLQHLA
jgi:hypothetical protein